MAGAMRKAMVYLGLVEDEDRYDYDDYDQDGSYDGEDRSRDRPADGVLARPRHRRERRQFRPRNRYVRQASFRSSARYGVNSE